MSSNTYTLKIDIDDSKIRDLEKRILAIMGMNGTQRGGIGSKMTDASKGGSGNSIGKNIAKLGIIAIGVGSLVGLVSKIASMLVDSSPMLQQMLKLLHFSVMLILRPIGDFIGFFLKPVIIYVLRAFVLPFYKEMRRPMMQAGAKLGEQFLDRPLETAAEKGVFGVGGQHIANIINGEYGKSLTAGALQIGLWFDSVFAIPGKLDFTGIDKWVADTFSIDNLPTVDWTAIKAFVSKFSLGNLPKINFFWVDEWFKKHFSIDNLPTIDWTWLKEFLKNFGILGVPTFSWSDLNDGLESIKTEVKKFIDSIVKVFTDLISLIPGIGSTTTPGGVTNNFIDLNGNGIDDLDDLKNMLPNLGDLFAGNGNNG